MTRNIQILRVCVLLIYGVGVSAPAFGNALDYASIIKPLFKERCYACHGSLKQKAGLRLDTAEFIRAGSKNGKILSRSAHESELVKRISSSNPDEVMPPEGEPLSSSEIDIITKWVMSGGEGPDGERPESDPFDHWAYQVIQPPPTDSSSNIPNPIDRLLQDIYESKDIEPAPLAHERQLVRRAFMGVIGLPPSSNDYAWYFSLSESNRWERLVDKLLSSPHYGERWGRHWMDIWRYTDWYGLGAQLRFSQKHIWHWRDWIVESLNEDIGYDEMIRQMIAADELYPSDIKKLRATGFLARNYYLFNRTTWLDKTIEHVGKGMLGLTFNCAKCHDHKYDPITQKQYYQMRAIFEPHQVRLDPVPGETNVEKNGIPRVFDAHPRVKTFLHLKGDEKNLDTSNEIQPGIFSIPSMGERFQVSPIKLNPDAHLPGIRDYVINDVLGEIESEIKNLQVQDAKLDNLRKSHIIYLQSKKTFVLARHDWEKALANKPSQPQEPDVTQLKATAREAFRLMKHNQVQWDILTIQFKITSEENAEKKLGLESELEKKQRELKEWSNPDHHPEVPRFQPSRKALESPAETAESRRAFYPNYSTGRRTALANWIVEDSNPLTSRVLVNHVWTRHFGKPLVESVFDFGRRQQSPELQDLLDTLAYETKSNGWKLKDLHKTILTSQAWKRSTLVNPSQKKNYQIDPENNLFWKKPEVRLESQVIRDSILMFAGQLDLSMGGASVNANPRKGPFRRSLYFLHSRDQQNKFLLQFDDADIEACYRRENSVLPQQALALTHSQLVLDMAPLIASQIRSEFAGKSDSEFVKKAFLILLGRKPDFKELEACLELVRQLEEPRRWDVLIHSLLSHHEFIYLL